MKNFLFEIGDLVKILDYGWVYPDWADMANHMKLDIDLWSQTKIKYNTFAYPYNKLWHIPRILQNRSWIIQGRGEKKIKRRLRWRNIYGIQSENFIFVIDEKGLELEMKVGLPDDLFEI